MIPGCYFSRLYCRKDFTSCCLKVTKNKLSSPGQYLDAVYAPVSVMDISSSRIQALKKEDDEKIMMKDYVTAMLEYGLYDEGYPKFHLKSVGTILSSNRWHPTENIHENEQYLVLAIDTNNQEALIQSLANLQMTSPPPPMRFNSSNFVDSFRTTMPRSASILWDQYQQQQITEGVWISNAQSNLLNHLNQLIDLFAQNEPIDYHPGTKNIVRDLVHPSLYPLLLTKTSEDETNSSQKNFWNRPYESSRFQWLPAEFEIDSLTRKVSIVSEINNLDRSKYSEIYNTLESVFEELLPGFEEIWRYCRTVSFEVDDQDWSDYEDVTRPLLAPLINFTHLQVIVKIADYILQPGEEFHGVWHYEGMAHENIVMTGILYLYSDHQLQSEIEFKRIYTDHEAGEIFWNVNQSRPDWFDEMIRVGFVPLGKTSTRTGQYLIFPNCHAHRVCPLINQTNEILRRRILVFFIVDPTRRIPSSRDYPPLPRTISLEEALRNRLELMHERKFAKQELNPREIELCEH